MFPESVEVRVARKPNAENFTNFIAGVEAQAGSDREEAWSRATKKFGS